MTTALLRRERVLDVAALDAVESRLLERERQRSALHAAQLRDVLEHRRLHHTAGLDVASEPALALLLGCSEWHARALGEQARLLGGLPGGLTALERGLLSVEGARAVVDLVGPLDVGPRLRVWELLRARLERDAATEAVLPPSRLREVLRRLVVRVDSEGAEVRRRRAVAETGLELRKRDDGLVDLFAFGLTAADGEALVGRLDAACPPSPDDDRTAAARRRDTLADLLLGRTPTRDRSAAAPAGCQVTVLVPLQAALAAADAAGADPEEQVVLAELPGAGGLLPSELAALLAAEPVLRAAWVDDAGVPVAVGTRTERPSPGLDAACAALRALAAATPPAERHPRHPDDHGPPEPSADRSDRPLLPAAATVRARPHPVGTPGPYRPPADLARLMAARSPRCEWPGCGTRAARCDDEHDVAHPAGPTCAFNLGPLCRRHHQVKQSGWTKVRTRDGGVRWTSPTGRSRTSPPQHRPEPTGRPYREDDLEDLLELLEDLHADDDEPPS